MKTAALATVGLVGLLCGGCSSGSEKPTRDGVEPRNETDGDKLSGTGKAFMDVHREIPPRLEWNRDVFSRKGGAIAFRVTSQGPFAVTIVTDMAYQALQRGDRKGLSKSDILLTVDSKNAVYDGRVTVPAGRSWFIIENQAGKKVEMRLECFEP